GRPAPRDAAVVDEVMRFCDVAELAGRSYPTLSGGERQRVNFARVLAQIWQPCPDGGRFLFLDEPLTFLDVGHQMDLLRKLRELRTARDLPVVGVAHHRALAARFAARLPPLRAGAVLAAGPPAEVMTPAHVRAAFGVEPLLAATPDGRRHLVFE